MSEPYRPTFLPICNAGEVVFEEKMGSDYTILKAARVSTGSEPIKGETADRGLIRRLWRDKHTSPFEQVYFTFKLTVPIFIARQIMRHRTFSYSEMSARYVTMPKPSFFRPKEWRKQAEKNHQGSSLETVKDRGFLDWHLNETEDRAMESYGYASTAGIAKELARIFYPVSMYTTFYMSGNLRNWLHFLTLRLDGHAQEEVRDVANAILFLIKAEGSFPFTIEIFEEDLKIEYAMIELKAKYKDDLAGLIQKLKEI